MGSKLATRACPCCSLLRNKILSWLPPCATFEIIQAKYCREQGAPENAKLGPIPLTSLTNLWGHQTNYRWFFFFKTYLARTVRKCLGLFGIMGSHQEVTRKCSNGLWWANSLTCNPHTKLALHQGPMCAIFGASRRETPGSCNICEILRRGTKFLYYQTQIRQGGNCRIW